MARISQKLHDAATTNATSSPVYHNDPAALTSFQAKIIGTSGPVQATVTLYGLHELNTNDGVPIASITLGDGIVTSDNKSIGSVAGYTCYYAIITGITGTGAAVSTWISN